MPAHWTFRFVVVAALLFGIFASKAAPHATVSIMHGHFSHPLTFVASTG